MLCFRFSLDSESKNFSLHHKKRPQGLSILYLPSSGIPGQELISSKILSQDLSKAKSLAAEIIENYEDSEYKSRAEYLLNMIKYKV